MLRQEFETCVGEGFTDSLYVGSVERFQFKVKLT
jgi:hypothetical protein